MNAPTVTRAREGRVELVPRGVGSQPGASQIGATPTHWHRLLPVAAVSVCLLIATTGAGETVRLDAEKAAARLVEVSAAAAAAGARSEAARAAVASADAGRLPQVAVSAGLADRSSVPEFRLPIGPPGQQPVLAPDIRTTYQTGLRVGESLYTGGALTASRQAARSDARASDAARGLVLAELRLTGRAAYWEAVRSRAALETTRSQQERAARLLDDTRALQAAGMAVRADVLAAEERVASARLAAIRADNAVAQADAALRSLLDLAPGDALELADTLAGPLPAPPGPLAELQHDAAAGRPELVAAEAQLATLKAREELARAPARPSVALTGQWDLARPNQRYFPLADAWKDSWSVGVQAGWTLFDGGKSRADAAGFRALQEAVRHDGDEIARRVALDVETARLGLESALAEVSAADAARASAFERETAARERLQAGLAAIFEMLDAQSALAAAEQSQTNARAGSWLALARLARALGR